MKFKSRSRYSGWVRSTRERRTRSLSMPQFQSSLAGEHAADASYERCNVFYWMKRINKMQRRRMTNEVMQQLCG